MRLSLLNLMQFNLVNLGIPQQELIQVHPEFKRLLEEIGPQIIYLSHRKSLKLMLSPLIILHQRISQFTNLPTIKGILENSGADILFPFVIYILILTNPQRIYIIADLLLQFIYSFKAEGFEQYCITNLVCI